MSEIMEVLSMGESFADAVTQMFRMAGITALVVVLIVGLIFFLPTIIASMRHIALRIPVCVLNVLGIAAFFLKIYIPLLIWLIAMILAITGKPERKRKNELPTINIITTKEED